MRIVTESASPLRAEVSLAAIVIFNDRACMKSHACSRSHKLENVAVAVSSLRFIIDRRLSALRTIKQRSK